MEVLGKWQGSEEIRLSIKGIILQLQIEQFPYFGVYTCAGTGQAP
jgi:hypothetical protein